MAQRRLQAKQEGSTAARAPRLGHRVVRVFDSFADAGADGAEREYWWAQTPAKRLRELERLRQLSYARRG